MILMVYYVEPLYVLYMKSVALMFNVRFSVLANENILFIEQSMSISTSILHEN